jgi:hypothetical protein
MQEGNSKRSFSAVSDQLMPMLKRRVDVSRIKDGPAVKPFDDLDVIYAVQGDHYFTVATKDDLERWGKSVGEIDSLALANLEQQTNKDQKLLCEPSGDQKLCGWASGDGYDATRMLVPGSGADREGARRPRCLRGPARERVRRLTRELCAL